MVRAILVERREPGSKSYLYELRELAEAAGYEVVGVVEQVRPPDSSYQIGRGKVEELAKLVRELRAEKVIFFNELKPVQVFNLQKALKVEVIDRFELILEIFAQRAGSREAKLQIELARLKRQLPYIKEALHKAKLGEYPGFLGGGEYVIDAYYKHVIRRVAKIEEELRRIRRRKDGYWARRREVGLPVISITGYTGAGKTTLFNALTGYKGYIDGKPFATLSTKVGRAKLLGRPVLVSDTVGFIDSLPPLLFDAFYTTLGEVLYADLVLLVVDISDEVSEVERKAGASMDILHELGVSYRRIVVAANKIDITADVEEKISYLRSLGSTVVPISALKRLNLLELEKALLASLPDYVRAELTIPFSRLGVLNELKCYGYVESIETIDGAVRVVAEGKLSLIKRVGEALREAGGSYVIRGGARLESSRAKVRPQAW